MRLPAKDPFNRAFATASASNCAQAVLRALLGCLFLLSHLSPSQAEPSGATYGVELTFSAPSLLDPELTDRWQILQRQVNWLRTLREVIQLRCPDCVIEKLPQKDPFTTPFHLRIGPDSLAHFTTDPHVIEAPTAPLSLSQWREKAGTFQRVVFESASSAGLNPHHWVGGGHINIGAESAFDSDPIMIRNFYVTLLNHSRALEFFGAHASQAPTWIHWAPEVRDGLTKALASSDVELRRGMRLEDFADSINGALESSSRGAKYQGVSLYKLTNFLPASRVIELRFFRPPEDAGTVVARLEALDRIVSKIRSLPKGHLVPLRPTHLSAMASPRPVSHLDDLALAAWQDLTQSHSRDLVASLTHDVDPARLEQRLKAARCWSGLAEMAAD